MTSPHLALARLASLRVAHIRGTSGQASKHCPREQSSRRGNGFCAKKSNMRKQDLPETSLTTSSYETALTSLSKNRDAKTPATEAPQEDSTRILPVSPRISLSLPEAPQEDSTRILPVSPRISLSLPEASQEDTTHILPVVSARISLSLPEAPQEDTTHILPVVSARVAETAPEWTLFPDTADQTAEFKPAVKVPSDEWLPERLSQLGIPHTPPDGGSSEVEPAHGISGEEPTEKPSGGDQTGGSRSPEGSIRPTTPGQKVAGQSEGLSSASTAKERGERGATSSPTRTHERDAALSEATAGSPRGTEPSVQATFHTAATSPFCVHSATSDEKRPHEDSATEPKVESPTQRSPATSSHSRPSPTRSRDKEIFELDDEPDDGPNAKRSFGGRLVFAGAVTVAVLLLALMSFALVKYMRNRSLPVAKGLFGTVRGQRLVVSDQGREWAVLAFLGVSFAKVPRGPVRFKPPQPLVSPLGEDQSGSTQDNMVKGPPCPQQDFYLGQHHVRTDNASEDCLHLNIWSPALNCSPGHETGSCEAKTVLFFLYGAAFQNGGNSYELYDGRYLSALGDLVVVVPNYRVGALGFLSGPSANTLPGNVGLHDQRLALSWTLANIEQFGGNASRLVLAGHDAGATSLGYHLFSGDSGFWTRSVTRFILQSGGPFHRYKNDGEDGAVHLATSLHCPADLVTDASLRCLQDASVDAVARSKVAPRFVPVFNRAPLTRPQIRRALDKTAPWNVTGPQGKEFLLGRVAREGAYPWFLEQQRSGIGDPQQLTASLVDYEVLERWQNATGIALDSAAADATYQEAVGDILEACPMSELAEQLYAWKNRVYAYVLAYRPTYSGWTDETEAVHFEDVELVFGVPLRPGAPSGELDKQWSRTMIRVWSTFARTGRTPTLMTTKWPEFDMLRLATMKLGPKQVTGQRDPKWQRCRALRDSSATPSLS
ncbi:acetylcholinesterase-like [Dermacentor albipictus]|uniref:acetylcholinesterase-like n=1 Tax=Dermacentor albipictus TaxID=60249 RepID=UPI0031FE3532